MTNPLTSDARAERPRRVQLKRTKGWRMPDNTVSVARPGPFGNPYDVRPGRTARQAVAAFREHVEESPGLREMIARKLPGKNLACWCALDKPCHADVLLEYAFRATYLPGGGE